MNSDGEVLSAEIKRRIDANCSVGISGVGPSFGRRKTIENVPVEFETAFRAHGAIEVSLTRNGILHLSLSDVHYRGTIGVWSTVHNDSIGRYDFERVFG